jgi:hypothetical protein
MQRSLKQVIPCFGVLEYWSIDRKEGSLRFESFHYSITPTLHDSKEVV